MRSETPSNLAHEMKSSKWLRPIVKMGLILDQDSRENLEDLRKFAHELGVESQNLKILLFLPKQMKLQQIPGVTSITLSDINWLGKLKPRAVKEFLSDSFDMLLCYQKHPSKMIEQLVKSSRAEFKVGRLEGNARIYDLAIASEHKDVKIFIEEVKKYLRILNRLD